MSTWFYRNAAGRVFGPLNPRQMAALAANGTLRPEFAVRNDGERAWTNAAAAGFFPGPPHAPRPAPPPRRSAPPPPRRPAAPEPAVPPPPPPPAPEPANVDLSAPPADPALAPLAADPAPPPPADPLRPRVAPIVFPPKENSFVSPPSPPPPPSFDDRSPEDNGGEDFSGDGDASPGSRPEPATVGELFTGAFSLGVANVFGILVSLLFWLLTIWIPYVNVGTTIALATLPRRLAEGDSIGPGFLFETRYRKYMGDYFLLTWLMGPPIFAASCFLLVPGIVLSLSWILAIPLVVGENISATGAMSRSNELMAGSKWPTFWAQFFVGMAFGFVFGILGSLLRESSDPTVLVILVAVVAILWFCAQIGIVAALFRKLVLRRPL